MEAQQVVDKILADAQDEAQKIRNQAQEKEAAEQAVLEQQLIEYHTETEQLAQKAGEDEKAHILAAARMEIAKELLAQKRKILDQLFEQARQQLQNLPDRDYKDVMKKFMTEAVETGDEEVVIGAQETRINKEFINQVNQQLSTHGKCNLKLSKEKQDISGGFILKRGKIKTNVTIDVLLDQARKELEIELAKKLFS